MAARQVSNNPMTTFYAIFARPYMNPGDLEFLALYSSQALAQRFIDCQDEQIRECLLVLNVEVDRHPSAEFWKRPDD